MLIDEIIPYEKNARHNEKAIPVVADSIREFGLRGQTLMFTMATCIMSIRQTVNLRG